MLEGVEVGVLVAVLVGGIGVGVAVLLLGTVSLVNEKI